MQGHSFCLYKDVPLLTLLPVHIKKKKRPVKVQMAKKSVRNHCLADHATLTYVVPVTSFRSFIAKSYASSNKEKK